MTATTATQSRPTGTRRPAESRRPPPVESLPWIGPLPQFLGDVLPFLTQCRATYGDAFRLRMANIEMTCLVGPEAIALLEPRSCLRVSKSMHVLDAELQSCLPSTFDGPQHQMFRKAHHQYMNARLESRRRADIQSCLARHSTPWRAGTELDVLHEAQAQLNLTHTHTQTHMLITYSATISTCGKGRQWALATTLLREMQHRNIEADVITYVCVVPCLAGIRMLREN